MPTLTRADAEQLLRFVSLAGTRRSRHQSFTPELLVELGRLVPADLVTYQAMEDGGWVYVTRPGESDEELGVVANDIPDEAEANALCSSDPIGRRRLAGSRETIMYSDFLTQQQVRRMPMHAEYLRFYEVNHRMNLRIPANPVAVLNFDRRGPGFGERDRLVLDLLRPYLGRIYAKAVERRRAVAKAHLTARETEVIGLVSRGKTNGEIAGALWLSPGTVRKHLENVFEKLGVHTRTAAAARFHALADADEDQLAPPAQFF
jgi:DNA-binding CsgD family transcriptional regulator